MNRSQFFRFCHFGFWGCVALLGGCGGGGSSPSGESTPVPTPDLSPYTMQTLGYFLADGAQFNDVGDVLVRRRRGSGFDYDPYRYHNGILTNYDDSVSMLSPSDGRYIARGTLHAEDGTPVPTPNGLPGTYYDGNYGQVVLVEHVAGEWAYGNTRQNADARYYAKPFRWKINGGPVEAVGSPGDYEYYTAGEQFVSRVSGGGNGRVLVQTNRGTIASAIVIEPNGTRVPLDTFDETSGSWFVRAAIAPNGTVIGSATPAFSSSVPTERAFAYSDGKSVLGPPGQFVALQGNDFLFEKDSQRFLWTPAGGKQPVPVSPLGADVVFARRNPRGQWLVAVSQSQSDPKFLLLTPK